MFALQCCAVLCQTHSGEKFCIVLHSLLHSSTAHSNAAQAFAGRAYITNLKQTNKQTSYCTALDIKALHSTAAQAFAG